MLRRRPQIQIRELKQPRRRRQRERQKTIGFNEQNNDSAHALDIVVHFFAVLCKQQREMTSFKGLGEREHTTVNFSFSS